MIIRGDGLATKWRKSPDGTLEEVDLESGQVLAVQKTKAKAHDGAVRVRGGPGRGRRPKDGAQTHHWMMIQGRKMWLPIGTNADDLPKTHWPRSQVIWDAICNLVCEGKSMLEIAEMEGFPPYHTMRHWRNLDKEFAAQLKTAMRDRASYLAELALEVAEESTSDTVASDKLKLDTYKWHSEVGDRDVYGKQQKITGDPEAPIGFIIDTGISREPRAVTDGDSPPPASVRGEEKPEIELRETGGVFVSEGSEPAAAPKNEDAALKEEGSE